MIPVNEPKIYKEMYSLTKQAIASGWLSREGSMVKTFEEKFIHYIGMNYGAATNSGTAALHLAIAALGITKGDEVIVPSLTIASCYFAVLYTGATVVPVDIDGETYTMNPSLIERAITKHTKAIMPVHLYGHPCDMDPIMRIAKKHHIYVIEDAAEAHGSTYKGKRVGSFGDISIFSFYTNKIVTSGEGGMILTNKKSIYDKILHLKNLSHSKGRRFIHDAIGYTYHMTNVQAALGLASFKHIQESIQKKQSMAALYNKGLQDIQGISLPKIQPWATSIYWMYAIRINKKEFGLDRDTVMKRLASLGIQTRTFFFSPKTAYKKLHLFQNKSFPVAERVEKEGLYIPSGLATSTKDMKKVIGALRSLQSS